MDFAGIYKKGDKTMENKGVMKLVLGGSGYGKSTYVLEELINKSMKNPHNNYIIVVPEQFTMATQKEIVERHPNHGVMNIDIVSFNRLAFRVFEELGISNLSILDDTGKTLILKRVIEDNKGSLNIYKNKANQSGFVEEMKSAVSELYSYGIDLDKFDNIVNITLDRPYISEKLKDIRLIYAAFKEALGSKYITKEEILSKLCGVIDRSDIIRNAEFVFDGFTGFTPIQYRLIGILLEKGCHITVTVTISAEEAEKLTDTGFKEIKEQELFNLSKTTINSLFALAADHHISIGSNNIVIMGRNCNYRLRNNGDIDFLEKNIFRNKNSTYKNTGNIKVIQMDNAMKEAELAAAYINDGVRNQGYRYRDFAVITGNLDIYRKLIETSFTENEIPFFMDNKRRLILNPCVAAIRAALDMVRDDFSYVSVFKFLRCKMTDINQDSIDILENYVLEYGIRGYKRYSKPFRRLKSGKDSELLNRVNEVREQFVSLISDFREKVSGKDKTVKDMTYAVYYLMEELSIYEKLKVYEERFNSEGKLSLSKEYSQTYGLVIELLDKLVELMGETVITVKDYGKLLEAGFEEIKVGVIPLNVDSVVVGDMERTRLSDIKVLFVLGVNDGIIPKMGEGTGLLTQRDRGYLKKLNVELSPTARESIFIQRFYLYQNLTKESHKLILTYSISTVDGKPARPSYLVGTIMDMYENKSIISENPFRYNIYTKELGLKYVAEHFVNSSEDMTDLVKELYTYFFSHKSLSHKLNKITEGAFFNSRTGKINSAVAKALYGDDVVKSASRLERYAACAYAHFLAYGLQLAQRKVYEINAADVGTVYHRVIELFSKEMKLRGCDFRTITDTDRENILDICMEKIYAADKENVFLDSHRNKYLLSRIRDVSLRTIWAISEHIKAGNFNPEDFELSFRDGRIDRVDTMEEDGRYYVKIIDYKSGNKAFDMEEMMNGLQIQLIYYMGAVVDIEKERHKDKTVMPAGAFYFNVKSPYVERPSEAYGYYDEYLSDEEKKKLEELYREAMLSEYKMTGLVNSDSEAACNMDISLNDGGKSSIIIPIKADELNSGIGKSSMGTINFTRVIEYVKNCAEKMCDEILEGNIDANPYKKGIFTPCQYCNYKGLCTFNEKYSGNKFRTLNKFQPEDIFKEITKDDNKQDIEGGEKNGSGMD